MVERVEERTVDEVRGPDHGGRLDKEAPRDASDGEADELGGHDDKPLVCEVVLLTVVHALNGDDICRVRALAPDGGHDRHEDLQSDRYGRLVTGIDSSGPKPRKGLQLTCSLMVNGPSFSATPNKVTFGINRAHSLPHGNDRSWATSWS